MQVEQYSQTEIDFFLSVFKETNTQSWRGWWAENSIKLEGTLSRGEFVRLKSGKVEYSLQILRALNHSVDWTQNARREEFLLSTPEDLLDEDGNESHKCFKSFFRNCIQDFYSQDLEATRDKILASFKVWNKKNKEFREGEYSRIFLTLAEAIPTGIYPDFFSFVLRIIYKDGPKSLKDRVKELPETYKWLN